MHPATFQKLMDKVLCGLTWNACLIDVIVYSRTFVEHLANLQSVLEKLRKAGLKLKTSKCKFASSSVKYLGHVSQNGVSTDPEKVEKVRQWPASRSTSEVKSFFGFAGYYHRFIQDSAEIAAPLTNLTSKRQQFRWSTEEHKAFEELKRRLCRVPVLAYPRFDVEFTLKTDASFVALSAVLTQLEGGVEKSVAFASRKLNPAEKKYCTTEREMLGIVWGINHFRPYLYGRKFTVITDHKPLSYLCSIKEPKGRQARWLQDISQDDFSVEHKPGRDHQDADALSRTPTLRGATNISTACEHVRRHTTLNVTA